MFSELFGLLCLNLDLQCNDAYLEFLNQVHDWCIGQLTARSTEYSKTKKTGAELETIFKKSATPHVSQMGIEYAPTLRTKINTLGSTAVRCWNPDKAARPTPADGLD